MKRNLGDERRRKGREGVLGGGRRGGRRRGRVEGDRVEGEGKGLDCLDKVKGLSGIQSKTLDQELHEIDLSLDSFLQVLLFLEGDPLPS